MAFNVLIAYDGSQHSTYALDWYVANIHREDNKVFLIHTNEPEFQPARAAYVGLSMPREEWELIVKRMREQEQTIQTESIDLLKQKGVKNVKFISRYGQPGNDIVQAAVDEHCDMIVVGSRGLGKIRRTLMGSVSTYVLHHAHVPVIVCRQPTV